MPAHPLARIRVSLRIPSFWNAGSFAAAQRDEHRIAPSDAHTAELERHLTALADRAAARLRAQGLAAGRVAVKIRRADFKTYTRQCVLGQPTQDTSVVSGAARRLLAGWLAEQPNAALRLLGVGTGDLGTLRQPDLFVTEPAKDTRLDAAVDDIRGRFGSGLLTRASLLPRGPRSSSDPRRG